MINELRLRLSVGAWLFCLGIHTVCQAGQPLSGTFRSAPGAVAEYIYHLGEYVTVSVPVDVTMTFSGHNATSTVSAIIHQPIIGVDDEGEPLFSIAREFPMAVTGTSTNGRDFYGDLLDTQYLFDWTIEPAAGVELIWNGTVGWAGGRVEITTIENVRLLPALAGDYNHDTSVDAADYVLWRKTLGQTGVGLAADGTGNDEVDDVDYEVWRAHFGTSLSSVANNTATVPEPDGLFAFLLAIATWFSGPAAPRQRKA